MSNLNKKKTIIDLFNLLKSDVNNWVDRVNKWKDSEEKDSNLYIKLDEERKSFNERIKLVRESLSTLTVKEINEMYGERIFNINFGKTEIIREVIESISGRISFISIIYFV